jgi:hypothetical protein
MSVKYIPFESKSGFRSPGFLVDESGDLTLEGSLNVSGVINTTGSFEVNGIPIIDASDSIISLDPIIKGSGLTRLGTLEFLEVDGDFTIGQGSTPYINVVNGHIEITSVAGTGQINNMDIGLIDPADGNFKSLNVGPGDSTGELSVQGYVNVTLDVNVGGDVSVTGNLEISSLPTEINHATRKDYVDSRISAFAIAFGA